MIFTYCFSVFPDPSKPFKKSIFDLFHMLNGRIEMEFEDYEFQKFRSELAESGLLLKEIERWPHHPPEKVR